MDSRKPSVDLGKELTCSICTELLYQPLTLLDCLHTYCGACLKEWFGFQAASAERAPSPPPPDAAVFTCPSCRSSVRDTRHNATVATLLDMFVAANPAKARSDDEKKEMGEKYKPGDQVLPKVKIRERTSEERRADEEDRRLLEEVREMSLREAQAGSTPRTRPRRRGDSRSSDERTRPSRDQSAGSRPRRTRDESRQRRGENGVRSSLDHQSVEGESRHRRRRSESRQRQVEHQSSLRSLIGSQMSERDIEREIEEFARQIQEEGLLDGLDLDNIDLSRDDELSRRITEAYRRRQRGRSRQEEGGRSNASRHNSAPRHAESIPADSRLRPSSARPQSRHRAHSRSTSEVEGRSRPPLSASANLEVRDPERRSRRRTASGGRSATAPIIASTPGVDARPAARSQTDLPLRSHTLSDPTASVPNLREGRSSSMNAVPVVTQPVELPTNGSGNNASFASRIPQGNPVAALATTISPEVVELATTRSSRSQRPADSTAASSLAPSPMDRPAAAPGHQRTRSQLYEEPAISCSRCNKSHIEYDLHYNCKTCADGQWNICVDCYRAGKGCLYWFGFGYGAWKKWEKHKQGDESVPMPHMLNAGRYLRPASTSPGSDTRKTLTTEDPRLRLETGTFCARCFAWTNDCFWRCDVCNEGDWGFCNDCVNQGRSCSHKLLPLAHELTNSALLTLPRGPRSPGRPAAATMLMGSQSPRIGPFKPLTFNTRCDVCRDAIPPSQVRYHCFSCTSTLVADSSPGDYDICSPCYGKLEAQGRISAENGHLGWRRCLNGHRMIAVGFVEGKIGQWRYVERDLVGGRALRSEAVESSEHAGLQKWSWHHGGEKSERLATKDVSATAPTSLGSVSYIHAQTLLPPEGGAGMRAHAMWSWYPKSGSEDELAFPRGADIREIRDINGDWFFGTCMGAKGLFPAPYVRMERGS